MKFSEKDISEILTYGGEIRKQITVQTVFKILSPLLTKEQVHDLRQFLTKAFYGKAVDKDIYGDKTSEMIGFIANASDDYISKAWLLEEVAKLDDSYTGNRTFTHIWKNIRIPDNLAKFIKRNEIRIKAKELKLLKQELKNL